MKQPGNRESWARAGQEPQICGIPVVCTAGEEDTHSLSHREREALTQSQTRAGSPAAGTREPLQTPACLLDRGAHTVCSPPPRQTAAGPGAEKSLERRIPAALFTRRGAPGARLTRSPAWPGPDPGARHPAPAPPGGRRPPPPPPGSRPVDISICGWQRSTRCHACGWVVAQAPHICAPHTPDIHMCGDSLSSFEPRLSQPVHTLRRAHVCCHTQTHLYTHNTHTSVPLVHLQTRTDPSRARDPRGPPAHKR